MKIFILCFSVLGAADYITGCRFGIGKEFEKAFKIVGTLALSMVGMIVLAPVIAELLSPLLNLTADWDFFEPSTISGFLLANDMGGAPLSKSIAKTAESGYFNGLIVGSMMGATVSFTLPFALSATEKAQHKNILLGLMCGITAIPAGCIISGIILKMPVKLLAVNLIPLIIFSGILILGLLKKPDFCLKIFKAFGILIKAVIIFGLVIGIIEFLTGYKLLKSAAPIEDGILTVFNIAAVMTGILPMLYILKKLLKRPLKALGNLLRINEVSTLGFISTSATSVTTFTMMKDMDEKGVILNSAFAVSAAFTFADHMAFTMSYNADYVPAVIIGKLTAGITAIFIALSVNKALIKKKTNKNIDSAS